MKKIKIAVLFGGCSSEYSVSLQSAFSVLTNLNTEKYEIIPIGITKHGEWLRYYGEWPQIPDDTWWKDQNYITPVAVLQSKSIHGIAEFTPSGTKITKINAAFPVLHGKNGEDGSVQGLFKLAGIPVVGCEILASALCMDKDRAHKLAAFAGVTVPKALVIHPNDEQQAAVAFAKRTGYPIFVKPVCAGSSYGVSKVQTETDLLQAITLAFQYDNQVILEENINGFEVGCAVMGNTELIVGEIDEIELSGGFFDYMEKYTLKTSCIHVPARIPRKTADKIKETAKTLYRALDCTGFARVDMFVTPKGDIVFNEINTIPGFTEHSRFPGMMQAAGMAFPKMLENLIEQAMIK